MDYFILKLSKYRELHLVYKQLSLAFLKLSGFSSGFRERHQTVLKSRVLAPHYSVDREVTGTQVLNGSISWPVAVSLLIDSKFKRLQKAFHYPVLSSATGRGRK